MLDTRYSRNDDGTCCQSNKKSEDANGKIILTKEEIIDTLKTLEGVKRKLQAALKRN
jgi:hypoxanthine-guanine phosphoribosyltransferase